MTMERSPLSPRRPHLLRAFYHWLIENQLTPHIVVDVTRPGVVVPMDFARDGQIVLNIAPKAVGHLELNLDDVRFDASFGGVSRSILIPIASILAIYARENGVGTMFEAEASYDATDQGSEAGLSEEPVSTEGLILVPDNKPIDTNQSVDDDPPPPRGGHRPRLRVIK